MSLIHTFILAVVEGITEFLPISSTGHLILASQLLHIPETLFTKSFDIIIQLGAILAVVVVYWKKLWNVEMIKKLIVAFIPTGIIGLALYKIVKTYLLGNVALVLWAMLLGGVIIVIFEYNYRRKNPTQITETTTPISYSQAFKIGLFQSISIIPGVSRSAATIIGGLWLGISRTTIVEFSFLLAIPTMAAATGLDLYKNASSFSSDQFTTLLFGFIVTFVVALISIKWLLQYVRKHDFMAFGVYRIVIAILAFLFFM